MEVISKEYVRQEVEKAITQILFASEEEGIKILKDVVRACKHDRETLRDMDKGKVIKWK